MTVMMRITLASQSDDSEDDDDMDEEGEMEMMDNELFANMDPEIRERFEKGEISMEELEKMGIAQFDDYGEEGERNQEDVELRGVCTSASSLA